MSIVATCMHMAIIYNNYEVLSAILPYLSIMKDNKYYMHIAMHNMKIDRCKNNKKTGGDISHTFYM